MSPLPYPSLNCDDLKHLDDIINEIRSYSSPNMPSLPSISTTPFASSIYTNSTVFISSATQTSSDHNITPLSYVAMVMVSLLPIGLLGYAISGSIIRRFRPSFPNPNDTVPTFHPHDPSHTIKSRRFPRADYGHIRSATLHCTETTIPSSRLGFDKSRKMKRPLFHRRFKWKKATASRTRLLNLKLNDFSILKRRKSLLLAHKNPPTHNSSFPPPYSSPTLPYSPPPQYPTCSKTVSRTSVLVGNGCWVEKEDLALGAGEGDDPFASSRRSEDGSERYNEHGYVPKKMAPVGGIVFL